MEAQYPKRLREMSDADYLQEVFAQIDAANQSPVYSDADVRAKACYEEGERRGRPDLYQRGFDAAYYAAKGDSRYRRALVALGAAT